MSGLSRSDQAEIVEAALRGDKACARCQRYFPADALERSFGFFCSPDGELCAECWDVVMDNMDHIEL